MWMAGTKERDGVEMERIVVGGVEGVIPLRIENGRLVKFSFET